MKTEMFKLQSIAKVFAGNSAPHKDDFSDNGIPSIRAGSLAFLTEGESIDKCEKIDKQLAAKNNLKLFSKHSILFAKSGMSAKMGRVYELQVDAYVVSHLAVIQADPKIVNSSYLKYFFIYRPPFHLIKDEAYPSIKISDINELEIELPDLLTQNKIVRVLDKAGTLIGKREKAIGLLDDLLRATFLDMFGDPAQSKKISKRISLGELGVWKSGGTPSRGNQDSFEGDIPWVTSGELNNLYISEANEKITKNALDNSNAKLIQPGSLLLGMYDTAALKSSISTIELACNQAIAYAKLDDKKCNTKFVYYNIQLGRDFFRSQQRGVRQQNMNLSMIKGIKILNPSLTEQSIFSNLVDKVHYQKQVLIKSKQELSNLNNSLLQKVFNGQLNFNVDFELDALIREIDLQKKENDLSKIEGDIAYLQRLIDKLNSQEFKEKDLYDKAKHGVFQLMAVKEVEKKVIQEYDENSKSVKLALK